MRWTQQPELATPPAVETARELEQRFYTQHHPRDLDDREGVIVVDARSGAAAPARYHRAGRPGVDGHRPQHVFDTYPDSPWAQSLSYADTLVDPSERDRSRLGIFRLNHPAHLDDVAALYNGRALRDRDRARFPQLPAEMRTTPIHKAAKKPTGVKGKFDESKQP